jgi:hypothetical protein
MTTRAVTSKAKKLFFQRSPAAFAFLLIALPSAANAQLDFSDAVAAKIRTYPVKRQDGKVVPGKDGMPQPEAMAGKQPANLIELPAVPVNPMFPGGSILDSLARYQKQDPMAALAAMVALLKNGYMELDIEKVCQNDAVKLQYDQRGTLAAPVFQEAGLTALRQIVADGVKAEELERARNRLRDRYDAGLSPDRKKDQEMMQLLSAKRLAIAMRYNPRIKTAAFASLPRRDAKERFKAEVAKGKPVEGDLAIGPIELAVKVLVNRSEKKPLPASCKKR